MFALASSAAVTNSWWESVAAIAASGAVVIAVLGWYFAQRDNRRQRTFLVLIDMLGEFRRPKFQEHRDYVRYELSYDVTRKPILRRDTQWPHVRALLYYYENVGLLLKEGVNKDSVIDYLGIPALEAWEVLEPFVKEVHRRRKNDLYARDYVELVREAQRKFGEDFVRKQIETEEAVTKATTTDV